LSPGGGISKNCCGITVSGYLVEIEKVDLQGLREQYPEAFAKDYDADAGLRVDGWIEGGNN
jgi:trimethylamine-N-oxide reductase (cytochrome c)